MMQLFDRLEFDDGANVRKTADGYLVANPRVARTGIQIYAGREVGRPEMERVRVYRSADQVFHKDSLRSYAFRPITNNHPPELVTADNWSKYGKGQTSGEVARDGEYVRVPAMLMDAAAIRDIEAGKRELSLGYTCDLKWDAGETEDGEKYDAVQTDIRANHLAVVKAARGGPALSIGDAGGGNPYHDPDDGRFTTGGSGGGGGGDKGKSEKSHATHPLPNTTDEQAAYDYTDKRYGTSTTIMVSKEKDGSYYAEAQDFDFTAPNADAMREKLKAYKAHHVGWEHKKGLRYGDAESLGDDEVGDFNENHDPRNGKFSEGGGRGGSKVKTAAKVAGVAAVIALLKRKGKVSADDLDDLEDDELDDLADKYDLDVDQDKSTAAKRLAIYRALREKGKLKDAESLGDENGEMLMKTITVDGISCEMEDKSAQIVLRHIDSLTQQVKDAKEETEEERKKREKFEKDHATLDATSKTEIATRDAEIVTLKKQVADGAITPQKIDQMVVDRAAVVTKAKTVIGDKVVTDGKTDAEIRRQVVDAKLGDIAKGWTDDQVSASFGTLTATAAAGPGAPVLDMARAFSVPAAVSDAREKAYQDRDRELESAYRKTAAA